MFVGSSGPLGRHPSVSRVRLAFAVDGADRLSMIVFTPATPADPLAIALPLAGQISDRVRELMIVVPVERIELPTFGLQNRCSTAELNRLSH
jgi:hypothetical protein